MKKEREIKIPVEGMKQILVKKLARESLCVCGFPAMKHGIAVGKEYKIPRFNMVGVSDEWTCGGCGKIREIHLIFVINQDGTIQQLPMELFNWDEEPQIIFEETQGASDPDQTG